MRFNPVPYVSEVQRQLALCLTPSDAFEAMANMVSETGGTSLVNSARSLLRRVLPDSSITFLAASSARFNQTSGEVGRFKLWYFRKVPSYKATLEAKA